MHRDLESWFTNLYREYGDVIFRHCYFRVSNRERAKELSQDVFIKAWQRLAEGEDIGNMRAFLYKVANNVIIDEWRKKKSLSLDQLQDKGFDPGSDPSSLLDVGMEGRDLIKYLDRMGQPCRDLLVMRFIDDLGPKEIAEIREETQNIVSVSINRCLKKVRLLIQGT